MQRVRWTHGDMFMDPGKQKNETHHIHVHSRYTISRFAHGTMTTMRHIDMEMQTHIGLVLGTRVGSATKGTKV